MDNIEKLKHLMKKKGITTKYLAGKIDYTTQNIYNIFNNRTVLTVEMLEKIVDGQVKKHFAEKVLMSQEFIKNDKQTVADFVKENISKTGENLIIRQFKRIELGVTE